MNSPRRYLLKILGINGLLTAVPAALLGLLPQRLMAAAGFSPKVASGTEASLINHIYIHFPEGTSVETANGHLDQWTNCPEYTAIMNEFKRDGRLFSYRVSRAQNPFVVELHLKSAEARQEFRDALQARGIFDESLRHELGYKVSETVYTNTDGSISTPRQIRRRA